MGYNETIFGCSDSMFGANLTLMDYMRELDFIDHPGTVETLCVVWYENDGEVMVQQIYDHDSGEIYWEDKTNDVWTDNDEELLNSLLMYGGLENTIGELY
tara:strand:- start:153 stop:452 length:300 start_codon:yes stop_codon:yes gene_type:complete